MNLLLKLVGENSYKSRTEELPNYQLPVSPKTFWKLKFQFSSAMTVTLVAQLVVALLAGSHWASWHQHGSENQVQGSLRGPAPPGKAKYFYSADSSDVASAKRTCANVYGKEYGLATIQDEYELNELKNFLEQNVSPGTELWIGGAHYDAYEEKPAEWVWDNLANPDTEDPVPFAPFLNKLWRSQGEKPNSVSRAIFTMMNRRDVRLTFDKLTTTRRFLCQYGKGIKPTPCIRKTDISVVLDSSGSISVPDYKKAKDGAANIVRSFALYRESRQQGIIFSDGAQEVLSLSFTGTVPEKMTKFINAPYLGRSTNTAAAITLASNTLRANKRSDAPQAMVVITDGGSNNRDATKKAVDAAKANGIKMVAVGIGSQINKDELNYIASSPKEVFLCGNWDELPRILEAISQAMCPKP